MKLARLALVPLIVLISFAGNGFAGTFETARRVAVGTAPSAVAVGDFNRDGKLDLVVTNNGDSSAQILLGNGNGTFKSESPIALDGPPVAVVVGDFNRDGKLDLAILTTDLFILLGNGDGTFQVSGMFAAAGVSLASADFNGDGKLDLALASDTAVQVLLGNGDGTFRAPVSYSTGPGSLWVATGDFNGDNKVDIIVSNFDQNSGAASVDVLLNKGNGTFGAAIEAGNLQAGGGSLTVGDFDGDGLLDVAVGNIYTSSYYTPPIGVLFGDGKGKFKAATYITTGTDSNFVIAADFNGDHKLDIMVANSGDNNVTNLLGSGRGGFKVGPNYAVGAGSLFLAVGDFNGDGRPDLVVADAGSNDVNVLLNVPGGHFIAARDFPTQGLYVAEGDFNRDHKQDLVSGESVLLGKGNGTFGPPMRVTGLVDSLVVTGDFNGDGASDIATFAGSSDYVTVILSNGDGTFKAPRTFYAGVAVKYLALGDFNGDGKEDLAVSAGKFIAVLLGNGDGTFQFPKSTFLGNTAFVLAVGDFNGDSKLDLAVSNQENNDVTILLGQGDGTFVKASSFQAGAIRALSIAVADFNHDNRLDLAVPDYYGGSVNVVLGNGDGTFSKVKKYTIGFPLSVVAGDFNLDGNPDLAVTAPGANLFVFFGKVDGSFHSATPIGSGPGGVWGITSGDLNSDGKPDLVVTGLDPIKGTSQQDVTVFLNVTKKKVP